MSTPEDPIARRRAAIARTVRIAKRVGYTALAGAGLAFFAALATDLAAWAVATTIVALVVAIVVLPVPIVLGYGLRAAERDDAQHRRRDATAGPDDQPGR